MNDKPELKLPPQKEQSFLTTLNRKDLINSEEFKNLDMKGLKELIDSSSSGNKPYVLLIRKRVRRPEDEIDISAAINKKEKLVETFDKLSISQQKTASSSLSLGLADEGLKEQEDIFDHISKVRTTKVFGKGEEEENVLNKIKGMNYLL